MRILSYLRELNDALKDFMKWVKELQREEL